MNVIKEIQKLNEKELERGTKEGSWHDQYKDSAWVFVGGLPYELSEGDVICVMSQWGEIEDLHLVRDKGSGKSKGFAFIKYEDQRSTVLAVDNFNGIKLLDRIIRVDHKEKYNLPKEIKDKEAEKEKEALEKGLPLPDGPKWKPGHAYEGKEIIGEHDIKKGVDLFARPKEESSSDEDDLDEEEEEEEDPAGGSRSEKKKRKKEEKKRRKEEKKRLKKEKKRKESSGEERRREKEDDDDRLGTRGSPVMDHTTSWERREDDSAPQQDLPPPSSGASWRGRFDPSARQQQHRGGGGGGRGGGFGGGRGFDTGGAGGGSLFGKAFRGGGGGGGRGSMSGIGGMNRKR